MDEWFYSRCMKKTSIDSNRYFIIDQGRFIMVILYDDDLILIRSDESLITWFKNELIREFEMTDLGELNYFLGLEVRHHYKNLVLSQVKYSLKILDNFKMKNYKSISSPMDSLSKLRVDDICKEVDSNLFI